MNRPCPASKTNRHRPISFQPKRRRKIRGMWRFADRLPRAGRGADPGSQGHPFSTSRASNVCRPHEPTTPACRLARFRQDRALRQFAFGLRLRLIGRHQLIRAEA